MHIRFVRTAAFVLALSALGWFADATPAEARMQLFRVWGQVHGALANGQGNYFDAQDGPYVGYGAQIGAQVIVFEAFLDLNIFDLGRDVAEISPTYWNQLGVGFNFPLPLFASDKVRMFARANVSYVYAPFNSIAGEDNRGFATRAGAGIEYVPTKFVAIGGAAYGGYHLFGTADNNDNGRHVLAQIYTRFEFGL